MNNLFTLPQVIKTVSIISISFMIWVFILNMFAFEEEGFIYVHKLWIYISVITLNLILLITKERKFVKETFKAPIYLFLGLYMTILMISHYINPYLTPNKYSFEFFFWTSIYLIILFTIYTNEKRNVIMSICFSAIPIIGFITFLFY